MPGRTTDTPPPPDDAELAEVLGDAMAAWQAIVARVAGEPGLTSEWKYYGDKHGWQWKVLDGKRTVLYLIPKEGWFTAATALSDDGVAAARTAGLPAPLVRAIEQGKKFAEGRPARVEVTGPEQVAVVERLLAIKLATSRAPPRGGRKKS